MNEGRFCCDFTGAVTRCRALVSRGQFGLFCTFIFLIRGQSYIDRTTTTRLRRRAAYVTCSVKLWRFVYVTLQDSCVSYCMASERALGRPRRRWEDNIKMDLQEVGCGGMDWMERGQNMDRWLALVNSVMNCRVL